MTLQEIAKEAGVSTTTVHRVLKGKRDVSPNTVKLVNEIMKKVGYPKPANGYDSLDGHYSGDFFKTKCIGLLLVGLPAELLKVPLFIRLLTEIEKALTDRGFIMSIMHLPNPEKLHPMISTDRLDGTFVFGHVPSKLLQSKLKEIHTVGLLGSEHYVEGWADWITSDFRIRGQMALKYLQERGHKRVAFLNPMRQHLAFREVGFSFYLTAEQEGLQVTLLEAVEAFPSRMWDANKGKSIVEGLVDQLVSIPERQRPTGLHVVNDEICINVYKSLRKRGIEPGKDIEIISCGNDEEFLSQMNPRPATMDLNVGEIARRAIDKLTFRVKNPDALLGVTVSIPPKLIPA